MKLTLGFSPCPNDTYIFDALVNKKIAGGGFEFDVILADVETLNEWAFEGRLDITKLSFPAFFKNLDKYLLLYAGAALGKGVGPLLITKPGNGQQFNHVQDMVIALPGEHTTANLLFSLAYPGATKKNFMRFDQIEHAVLSGKADAGVIIHENRFTYRQKGLVKITDLGEYWEDKMKVPIPLGGIAIKRNTGSEINSAINGLIRESIEYANSHYPEIPVYVIEYASEMEENVMRQHIELYVNDFSLDLRQDGCHAITTLFDVFRKEFTNVSYHSSGGLFIS